MLKMTLHYKRGHAKTSMDFAMMGMVEKLQLITWKPALQPLYRQYLF